MNNSITFVLSRIWKNLKELQDWSIPNIWIFTKSLILKWNRYQFLEIGLFPFQPQFFLTKFIELWNVLENFFKFARQLSPFFRSICRKRISGKLNHRITLYHPHLTNWLSEYIDLDIWDHWCTPSILYSLLFLSAELNVGQWCRRLRNKPKYQSNFNCLVHLFMFNAHFLSSGPKVNINFSQTWSTLYKCPHKINCSLFIHL